MDFMPTLGGCTDYLLGTLDGKYTLTLSLPKKRPYCLYCRLLHSDRTLDRHTCRLTQRYVFNPQKQLDEGCPIEWKEMEENSET